MPDNRITNLLAQENKHSFFMKLSHANQFDLICELLRQKCESTLDELIHLGINISFYHQCLLPISIAAREGNEWGVNYLFSRFNGMYFEAYTGYALAGNRKRMDDLFIQAIEQPYYRGEQSYRVNILIHLCIINGQIEIVNELLDSDLIIDSLGISKEKAQSRVRECLQKVNASNRDTIQIFLDEKLYSDFGVTTALLINIIYLINLFGIRKFIEAINYYNHLPHAHSYHNQAQYIWEGCVAPITRYYGPEIGSELISCISKIRDKTKLRHQFNEGLVLGMHTNYINHQSGLFTQIENRNNETLLIRTSLSHQRYDLLAQGIEYVNLEWLTWYLESELTDLEQRTNAVTEIAAQLILANKRQLARQVILAAKIEPGLKNNNNLFEDKALRDRINLTAYQLAEIMQRFNITFKQALGLPLETVRRHNAWLRLHKNPLYYASRLPHDLLRTISSYSMGLPTHSVEYYRSHLPPEPTKTVSRTQDIMVDFMQSDDKRLAFLMLSYSQQFTLICNLTHAHQEKYLDELINLDINIYFFYDAKTPATVAAMEDNDWGVNYFKDKFEDAKTEAYIGYGLAGNLQKMKALYDYEANTTEQNYLPSFSVDRLFSMLHRCYLTKQLATIDYFKKSPQFHAHMKFCVKSTELDRASTDSLDINIKWDSFMSEYRQSKIRRQTLVLILSFIHRGGISALIHYIKRKLAALSDDAKNIMMDMFIDVVTHQYGPHVGLELVKLAIEHRLTNEMIKSFLTGIAKGFHSNYLHYSLPYDNISISPANYTSIFSTHFINKNRLDLALPFMDEIAIKKHCYSHCDLDSPIQPNKKLHKLELAARLICSNKVSFAKQYIFRPDSFDYRHHGASVKQIARYKKAEKIALYREQLGLSFKQAHYLMNLEAMVIPDLFNIIKAWLVLRFDSTMYPSVLKPAATDLINSYLLNVPAHQAQIAEKAVFTAQHSNSMWPRHKQPIYKPVDTEKFEMLNACFRQSP